MPSYQLEGIITYIGDNVQITETLKKRVFVVRSCVNEISNKWEEIEIETYQDNCSLLDDYKENDQVKVSFIVRCKKWESPDDHSVRYFTHLVGWKIEKLQEIRDDFLNKSERNSNQDIKEEDLDNFTF